MNKREKIVQAEFIGKEESIIKRLKQVYNQALKDIETESKALNDQINSLQGAISTSTDAEEQKVLQSMMQSKVYQKQHQDALKSQVGSILAKMHVEEFKSVSEYLFQCYELGFLGTLYDLHGQGIPLVFPMDQEAVVRAVQLDSKISEGLYTRLGEDVSVLKKKISSSVSRGIATGRSWGDMARELEKQTNIGFNNAVRITRTEGHRIQNQAAMDAGFNAVERGADMVKQWDSTLDGLTRASHRRMDGEIREMSEKFSNGLMQPGDPSGAAAEVIQCRCALLQRSRSELKDGFTKWNNFTGELEEFKSPEDYEEFKKAFFSEDNVKYMKYVQDKEKKYKTYNRKALMEKLSPREKEHYEKLLENSPMYGTKVVKKNSLNPIANSEKSDIIKNKISNATIVPDEKFLKYSLNMDKAPDKAKAFKSALGYDQSNYKELKQKIERAIDESKFVEKGDSGYGMRYEYIIEITGANGKKANVLTAWIQDGNDKRMTSVYVTKRGITK